MHRKIVFFLIITNLVFFPIKGFAMSFLTKQVLFSEVSGLVLQDGKPLANVEVVRSYSEVDKEGSESVKTNKNGTFYFPNATNTLFFEFSFFPPSEIVISQEIIIKYEGKAYDAWVFAKDDYKEGSEVGKKVINISCNLDDKPDYTKLPSGNSVFGICSLKD